MTENELREMKKLIQEARQLQRESNNLPTTKDSVKGSAEGYPYTEHTVLIYGVDEKRGKRIRRKLKRKLEEIQEKVEEMEEWLNGIDDPEIRMILRMMYRNAMTQKQIGDELGYDRSVISRKVKKFWEKESCTQNTQ